MKLLINKLLAKRKLILLIAPVFILAITIGGLGFEKWEVQRFFIFYTAPFVGLYIFSFFYRIIEYSNNIKHLYTDGIILFLGLLRVSTIAPYSGHMLFLTYSFFIITSVPFRLLCFIVYINTIYFKIYIWGDVISLILGIALSIPFIIYEKKQ